MSLNSQLQLSYYKKIATLNEEHEIHIVQHIQTKKICVMKTLTPYNIPLYKELAKNTFSNIPYIYEIIEDESALYVVEEYISGDSLADILATKGALSEATAIEYILKLCDLLTPFHNHTPAIVNRDIKPENIILRPSGDLVLIDFDSAKYEKNNTDTILLGTHGYAAPEQYGFGASSPQTDIYALGKLLNELLTGDINKPYDAGLDVASLDNVNIYHSPLREIIDTCTKLNSSDRYRNLLELKQALMAINAPTETDSLTTKTITEEMGDKSDSDKYDHNHITDKFNPYTSWLPPGYRSKKPISMLLATFMYTFFVFTGVVATIENSACILLDRIYIVVFLISVAFIYGNYKNMLKFIPICLHENFWVRLLSRTLLVIVWCFVSLFILVIIEDFLS